MAKVNIKLQTKGNTTTVKVRGKKIGTVKMYSTDEYKAFLPNGNQLNTFGHLHDAARALFKVWQEELNASRVVDRDKLMPILNNHELFQTLENLHFRWSCEKEFEDWSDYEKIIESAFEKVGAHVVKTTRRPIGAVVNIEGMTPIKIFRKANGNQAWLASAAA